MEHTAERFRFGERAERSKIATVTTRPPNPGHTLAVAAAGTLLDLQVLRGRRERGEPLAIPNRECFPFCDNHRDFDEHDLFIDELDEIDEFDEAFVEVELDDCEIVDFDGDDATVACEVDFDF